MSFATVMTGGMIVIAVSEPPPTSLPPLMALGALTGAGLGDIRTRRVPNRYLAAAVPVVSAVTAVTGATQDLAALGSAVAGFVALTAIFLVIHLKNPDSFGAADVKVAGMAGLGVCWFGIDRLAWVLGGSWIAMAAVALPTLVVRRRRGRQDPHVPFVPFLAIGTLGSVLLSL